MTPIKQLNKGTTSLRFAFILISIAAAMLVISSCARAYPAPTDTIDLNEQSSRTADGGAPADGGSPGNAAIAIDPSSGGADTTVNVRGSGWTPGEMVNIILADQAGRSDVLTAKAAEADGSFETSFIYPNFDRWTSPGNYFVLAYTPDHDVEVTALFLVGSASSAPVAQNTATSTLASAPVSRATATATAALASASGPSVTVVPDRGSAFTEVVVSGGGFPANVRVNLHLAGLVQTRALAGSQPYVYASTITNNSGAYRMIFPMPPNWPDGRTLESGQITVLVATDDFSRRASAIFDFVATAPTPTNTSTATSTPTPTYTNTPTPTPAVRPFARVSPSSGAGGTFVTVSGGGFPARTVVNVHLAGLVQTRGGSTQSPFTYASATTGANGTYQMVFAMPYTWPDGRAIQTGDLTVLVTTNNFAIRASDTFSYVATEPTHTPTHTPTAAPPPGQAPFAEVIPSSGGAGTEVTVTGGGFPARTQINIYLGKFDGQIGSGSRVVYATGSSDAYGDFNIRFTLPVAWPDGTPIESGKILILAATPDLVIQASAVFDYLRTVGQVPVVPTVTPTATPTRTPAAVDPFVWNASYWNNVRFAGPPVLTRLDENVNFDWGFNSPDPAVDRDYFSVRWTRQVLLDAGVYVFSVTVDDGARLYVDGQLILDAWQVGSERTFTVDAWLSSGYHEVVLEYFERTERAVIRFDFRGADQGWLGEYFDNMSLSGGPVLVRNDPEINFAWELGSPGSAVPVDNFSARWTRQVLFDAGIYRFTAHVDDGVRVWIDDTLIIDEWHDARSNTYVVDVNLPAGPHALRVEYFENTLGARMHFWWESRSPAAAPGAPTATPTAQPTATPTPTHTPVANSDGALRVITVGIVAGRDDAEQQGDGRVKHDSDELEMVDHSSGQQNIGLRFQNVPIPQGAVIVRAHIDFTAEAISSRQTSLLFQGEAVDNAARYERERFNISYRNQTTARVQWNDIEPWTNVGQVSRSPNLAPIVQEIVNRSGWRPGNALSFIISGNGQRIAESYDGNPGAAPRLYVEFR